MERAPPSFYAHSQVQVVTAPEAATIPLRLHVPPQAQLSERAPEGQALGAATRRMPGLQSVSAEQDLILAAELRATLREGAEQKLTEQLRQVEAQVPQAQRGAWNSWLQEWRQAESGPFAMRLFLLGTLFFRVLQPARKIPMSAAAKGQWEALISALWSTLQQFLPRGRWVKDFLKICHLSWQEQNREQNQNVTLGQIVANLFTLSLSQLNQQRLEAWLQGLAKIPEHDTEQHVRHCAILMLCFLPALVDTLNRPRQDVLAEIDMHLRAWIASRLPPETSLEAFLQTCRARIVQGAVTEWQTAQIRNATQEQRDLVRSSVEHLQQHRQSLVATMTEVQEQRRQMLTTADSVAQVSGELQQELTALHATTQRIHELAYREESAQQIFHEQLTHLQEEAKRL